ncbi:MAG: putative DNA binding domain-containing protein [Candidatus Thermoplasmatota archaeon]|nr:putative DNA binding domain-containing protein [Candidatus Thermoplasmatota archaeon]
MESDPIQLRLQHLLSMGEGIRVEYKEAKRSLPSNVFETICAMLNRDGGNILLGVDDQGKILGIDPQSLEKIKTNLVDLSNNSQKLDPPFILFPDEHIIDGQKILHISIPASSQVHKTNGVVLDRSNDGDFRVTEPHRIAEISNRKRTTYTENTIYSATTVDDLRMEMLPRLRNLMLTRGPNHPWIELSDEQLLLKAGLFRKDLETGKEGYTLAAILLLGKDETIRSALPHYKIDAMVRRVQLDHYDDRDRIDCNLIEAYDRLMAFIAKHLSDPFYLEGDVRISLRYKIFREVIANFLVHREYMNPYPARLIIYNNRVETTNASNYRIEGLLDPEKVVPFSKNPVIAKFFTQLNWVEEIGSGMMNIGKYLPHYTPGGVPEYRDGSVFTTVIPIKPPYESKEITEEVQSKVENNFRVKFRENFRVKFSVIGKQLDRMTEMILRLSSGKVLIVKELATEFDVSVRTIHEDLRRLEGWDIIKFEGAPKTGKYVLTENGKLLLEGVGQDD